MFKVKLFPLKPLTWWYSQYQQKNIDLAPVFQRKGNIWKSAEKKYLIDSILNDYDIPKFYLADNTYGISPRDSGKKMFSVIDGKQRFETIFAFFDNKLELAKDFLLSDNANLQIGGLNYSTLKIQYPEIARRIEEYEISVMRVITDEQERINDMFIRLNKTSKALVGAEIRNATISRATRMIQKLSKHKFFKFNIKFNIQRMQESNAVAKMLLLETHGRFVDMKKRNLDRLVEETLEPQDFEKSQLRHWVDIYRTVGRMLNRMTKVFQKGDPLLNSQGPLIWYYWLIKRNLGDDNKQLRNFLRYFDEMKRKNNAILKKGVNATRDEIAKIDQDLSNYQSFSRSPNDGGNMTRCFEILSKKYVEFKSKTVN